MRRPSNPPGSIQYDGETIAYVVVRRPRVTRRVHLELGADGGLEVVAPAGMSRRAVHQALQARPGRVACFLSRARARQRELPERAYCDGEVHLFLGEPCILKLHSNGPGGAELRLQDAIFEAPALATREAMRDLFRRWYRARAEQLFSRRLAAISSAAPWVQGHVPPMRLRRMKRTWGNCSSAGLITLNPHLVKAPPELIDYVIAHEVCHLREHNHGTGFYALQQQLFPGWRQARSLLRQRGHIYLHD